MTWRMKIFRLRTIAVGVMALSIVVVMGCGTSSPPPDPASSPMPLTPVDPNSPTVAIGDRPTAAIRPTKARLAPSTELQPTKTRLAPSVSNSEMADLVGGNNAFAFDLYRALSEQDGNLFYSPYSISMAVAMAYAGARGETEQQIADTLHYRLPQDRLHSSFNALDLDLASRGGEPKGQDQEGFQIFIANAVWGQEGYGFLDSFLDLLDENYGGDLRQVDFLQAPNASRLKINDWVAERTEDRIKPQSTEEMRVAAW